jgi:electron transport complex protein RnfG
MKKSLNLICVLTFTAAISGGLLSYFNMFTAPLIAEHKRKALEESIALVIPGTVSFEEVIKEDVTFYVGKNKDGAVQGVAFEAVESGYQDKIKALVGTDSAMTEVLAIKILEQKETPGLGTKIEVDPANKSNPTWFGDQFKGLSTEAPITYVKNQKPSGSSQIQAISGATISSKAVVDALNKALKKNRVLYLSTAG